MRGKAVEALGKVQGLLEANLEKAETQEEKDELEQSMKDIQAILDRWSGE